MEISELIKPLGIITYVFVVLTFLAGLLRAKLKLKLKHHKALAWTAVTWPACTGCWCSFIINARDRGGNMVEESFRPAAAFLLVY